MQIMTHFYGKVQKGAARGRQLGFPTANLRLHKKIPEGIYAAQVLIDKTVYNAAAFIGSAKTFGEKEYKAEIYILDFSKDLYGKYLSVRLYKKIRDNKTFAGKEALILQMEKDIKEIRKIISFGV